MLLNLYNLLIENWEAVGAVLLALHGLAVVVTNITPTPKDDAILAKTYRVVEIVAGLISHKAKEPSGKPTAKP